MGWGSGNLGGGSGGINFKIVGGTSEPASPKENEIWVNTDTEITSYIFSATEPATPEAGMVWITTGTASGVKFNALKKNSIMVYPLYAKQYIDGTWINVSAMSYQNGSWVEWMTKTYIYKDGEAFTSISYGSGTSTNEKEMYLSGSPNDLSHQVITEYQYGIGSFKKLVAEVSGNSGVAVVIGIAKTATNIMFFNQLTAYTSIYSTGKVELDISNISGLFNIVIAAYGNGGCNVTKWYFEG